MTPDEIVAQYPQFAFMLQDPELHWLLVMHLDPARGFDSGAFQADLAKTNWWRTHSSSQRQWLQTTTMDPATAEATLQRKIGDLMALASAGGLPLTEAELRFVAAEALQFGWDDRQTRSHMVIVSTQNHGEAPGTGRMTGGAAQTGNDIRNLAREYMIPMTDQQVGSHAQAVFVGVKTMDDVKGDLSAWAAGQWGGRNPDLAQFIKQGGTVRQWMDPQIQAVSQLLEVSADEVDPLQAKYASLINYTDPEAKAGGQPRIMTVPEVQRWARSQDEWGNTGNAREVGANYTSALLREMGSIK